MRKRWQRAYRQRSRRDTAPRKSRGGMGLDEVDFVHIAEACRLCRAARTAGRTCRRRRATCWPPPVTKHPLLARCRDRRSNDRSRPPASIPLLRTPTPQRLSCLQNHDEVHLDRSPRTPSWTREPSIDPFRRLFRVDWTPTAATRIADARHRQGVVERRAGPRRFVRCRAMPRPGATRASPGSRIRQGAALSSANRSAPIRRSSITSPASQVKIEFCRPVLYAAAARIPAIAMRTAARRISHAKLRRLRGGRPGCADLDPGARRDGLQLGGRRAFLPQARAGAHLRLGRSSFHRARVATPCVRPSARTRQTFASESRPMPEAYIIDAVRTPIGRKKGSLATLHSG